MIRYINKHTMRINEIFKNLKYKYNTIVCSAVHKRKHILIIYRIALMCDLFFYYSDMDLSEQNSLFISIQRERGSKIKKR